MTPEALQSYAKAKLAENRFLINTGTTEQRERAVVNLICEVYGEAWLDGLNDGHRATMDGAKQAIGVPQCALLGEATYPPHDVHPANDPHAVVAAIASTKRN